MQVLNRLYSNFMRRIQRGSFRKKASFLGLFSMAESVIIPFPVDPVLVVLGLATPSKALKYAFVTTVTSVLGGVVGYFIGFFFWNSVSGFFPETFTSQLNEAFELFRKHDSLTIFIAGFTPIPFKIFTLAGGIAKISFFHFLIFSFLSRGLRFFLIGGLLFYKGEAMKPFIEKYFHKIIWIITLVVLLIYLMVVYA